MGHVATEGSLLGSAGKWGACGWAAVQLDYDEELAHLHGMYGLTEAELEVQRTIKRVELTAFPCLRKKVKGPNRCMSTTKEFLMGHGEEEENASNQKLERPICGSRSGKNCTGWPQEIWRWKRSMSRHTARRKTRKRCRALKKFVTGGNEKADELAKELAMLDKGFMTEARAKTMQLEREEVYAALQYAASFHCLVEEWKVCDELKPKPQEKRIFVDQKKEETKHGMEWCAEANKYRCMRCGKKQQTFEDAREMRRTKFLVKKLEKMEKASPWRA